MALSMFTIIPTPYVEWDDEGIKNMMKFYPVIGLIVGSIWSIVYYLMIKLDCSIVLKSVVVTITPFIITGMLHLDGYMDVCDAILSRRERKEKLRILKDSTIGAFAVVSLVMLFLLQFSVMYSLVEEKIEFYYFILIAILSRATVAYYMLKVVTIKESSLGTYFKKGTGKFDRILMILIIAILFFICYYLSGFRAITMVLTSIFVISICTFKCFKEFGGISGDVAGFSLVLGELFGLLSLCIN